MLRPLLLPWWCWALCALLCACGEQPAEVSAPPGTAAIEGPVLASTWPLASLANELLGEEPTVRCWLPAGEDPAFWQPSDDDLRAALRAPGLLLNGANLEPWASTANLPSSRTLRTGRAFRRQWIEEPGGTTHSHGPQGAHSHKGYDPYFWMDPLLAWEQARAIQSTALGHGWIDGAQAQSRLAALEVRLKELDALWVEIATALGSEPLFANHASYRYPARRHGLAIHVLHQDPQQPWSEAAEAERKSLPKEARYFLMDAVPSPELTRTLVEQEGLTPILLRPAAAPIEGFASALDVWRADLLAFRDRLTSPDSD